MSIDTPYTNSPRSRVSTTTPPAATRPRRYQQSAATASGSQEASSAAGAQTVSITIDIERLCQLEELLCFLGLPPLVPSAGNRTDSQENTETRGVEPTTCSSAVSNLARAELQDGRIEPQNRRTKPQNRRTEPQDGRTDHSEPSDILEMTGAFSCLSTANNPSPALFEARTLFGNPPPSPLSPRRNSSKYFAVLVGKCAGVYYGEWDDVRCLTDHVSGARYKSFKTFSEAAEFYLDAKRKGRVDTVRDLGDEKRFGPIEDAVQ